MSADPQGFIDNLTSAVNDQDIDRLVDCFAQDYVNITPAHPARGFTGREQVRRNWSAIFDAVPDITTAVVAQAIDGNSIWTESRIDGTRRDGTEHHMRGVVVFTVAGRQASSARFYLEPLDTSSSDAESAVATQLSTKATDS